MMGEIALDRGKAISIDGFCQLDVNEKRIAVIKVASNRGCYLCRYNFRDRYISKCIIKFINKILITLYQ